MFLFEQICRYCESASIKRFQEITRLFLQRVFCKEYPKEKQKEIFARQLLSVPLQTDICRLQNGEWRKAKNVSAKRGCIF